MKKKNFYMLLGAVLGGLLFALGMCMCLVKEWDMFNAGCVFAGAGLVILIAVYIMYRKASGRKAQKPDWKLIGKIAYGVLAIWLCRENRKMLVWMLTEVVMDGAGLLLAIAGWPLEMAAQGIHAALCSATLPICVYGLCTNAE